MLYYFIYHLHYNNNFLLSLFYSCNLTEMRSLNVVLDKPNHVAVDKSIFVQKYFQMLPLKMDPSFGLYKIKLFKKVNEEFIDIFDILNNMGANIVNKQFSVPENLTEFISITEINVCI